jgi:hypothetical protein
VFLGAVSSSLDGRGKQCSELVGVQLTQTGCLDALPQEAESDDERGDGLDMSAGRRGQPERVRDRLDQLGV